MQQQHQQRMPLAAHEQQHADEACLTDSGAVDIETALNHVGVGPFQWMALVVCGLANAADAVEILGMSLVLPAAEADPSFELTASGKSALSSCIFLGMLLGGLLWGPMGDVLGRRHSLLIALLINAFFGVMSAGARSVGALVGMRLLGGVGVGGSVPVVFSYLAELLPAKARGRYMVGLAAHWMVGSIFSAGMGWAIIPTGPSAWRLFLAVASLPAWAAAVGAWLMPESPRFLLVRGETEAAEQVLHKMAAINNSRGSGSSRARQLRLIPHQSHHMPLLHPSSAPLTPPPPPPEEEAEPGGGRYGSSRSRSSSRAGAQSGGDGDVSWQHAPGHTSQHFQLQQQQQQHRLTVFSPSGQRAYTPDVPPRHRVGSDGGGGGGGSSSGVAVGSGGDGVGSSARTSEAAAAQRAASSSPWQQQQQQQLQQRRPQHQQHQHHLDRQQVQQAAGFKQQQRQCCRSSFMAARLLMQQPLRRRFLPLMVAWLGLCGGWYSTVLWIPEYFKARGAHSASLYAETFAVAAANLPGNIASIFMVDWLGRRLTACVCLAGACGAALLFAFAPADPVWSVAAACIFNGISVGGWNALDLLSAELFATEVRSTAMGLLGAFGRLASFTTTFMAGALMQKLLWSPLLVAAGLLAAGSIAIMLLPEMAHKPLEDTVEDATDSEVVVAVMSVHSASEQGRPVLPPAEEATFGDPRLASSSTSSARGSAGFRGGADNSSSRSYREAGREGAQQPPQQRQQRGGYSSPGVEEVELVPASSTAAVGGSGGVDMQARPSEEDELIREERLGLLQAAVKP